MIMEWGMNSVPARTETIQVTIGDLVFPPADIKAKAGGTVTCARASSSTRPA
jgi:plastocyanin